MEEKDQQEMWGELLAKFKSGKINRRQLLRAASAAGMTAAALKLISLIETGSMSGPIADAASIPTKKRSYTVDPVTTALINRAQNLKIKLVWNRFIDKERNSRPEPTYATCINCQQGPCRKVNHGTCGMDASGIVARNLLRETAAGTAAHLGHARRVATILKRVGEGSLTAYSIKDEAKLNGIYQGLFGGEGTATTPEEKAREIGEATLGDLSYLERIDADTLENLPPRWLAYKANAERQAKWKGLGLLPVGGAPEVQEAMHMATIGVNADYVQFILRCARMGLVDGYCGLHAASGMQDILFKNPELILAKSNLSVIDPDQINLAIHGHVPLLAEKIVEKADAYNAAHSPTINVVGFCCTGNELLMRHGIGIAGDYLQQELAIVTGALEAMVVDVQCVMPSLADVAKSFHTKIITTDPIGKQEAESPVVHIEFNPLDPTLTDTDIESVAQQIIDTTVANRANRVPSKVFNDLKRPLRAEMEPSDLVAGFSTEQIVGALAPLNPGGNPLKPLIDNVINGNIRGIAAVVGCVTPRDVYGYRTVEIVKGLINANVLVAITGCTAIVAAHHGLLKADPAYPGVGSKLKGVLQAIASANGLPAVPACLHMGS